MFLSKFVAMLLITILTLYHQVIQYVSKIWIDFFRLEYFLAVAARLSVTFLYAIFAEQLTASLTLFWLPH